MAQRTSFEASDEATIAELYARFNARDTQQLSRLLHPDATWINASKNLRLHGIDEIIDHWHGYWRQVSIELTPRTIKRGSSGYSVDLIERIVSQTGEQIFVGPVRHVFTLIDDRVGCCFILDVEAT